MKMSNSDKIFCNESINVKNKKKNSKKFSKQCFNRMKIILKTLQVINKYYWSLFKRYAFAKKEKKKFDFKIF